MNKRRQILKAVSTLPMMHMLPAGAQAFPGKPVRVVVPTPAGGIADVCIRAALERMRQILGQSFVVENQTGATGNIGLQTVAAAAPDGYTLAGASAANSANLATRPKQAFDLTGDLRPIGKVGVAAFTLAVPPSLGIKTVEEFIQYAKARPGALAYGSIGYGSSQHLVAEIFCSLAKLDMMHVPYRGESPASQDMMTGRIHAMFMAGAKPYVTSGKLVGLATTNRETWPSMPELRPIGETEALRGFEYNGWNGLMAPRKTPDAIVGSLSDALAQALGDERLRTSLRGMGFEAGKGTPDDMAEQIRKDLANFRKVIEERRLTFPD